MTKIAYGVVVDGDVVGRAGKGAQRGALGSGRALRNAWPMKPSGRPPVGILDPNACLCDTERSK